jgi:hypothetical protein
VKWLELIDVRDSPFQGFYQSDRYVFERRRDGETVREPVRFQRVRSIITEPTDDDEVGLGNLIIRGVAWSGSAPIDTVEVSVGDGPWRSARLIGESHAHGWRRWEVVARLDRTGPTTLRARATDLSGAAQPDEPEWNRLGYGCNAIQVVPIQVG